MRPAFEPGDRVLVARLRPREGDAVAVLDPRDDGRVVIKRLVTIDAGGLFVIGDNAPESTDSRQFGAVARPRYIGRVIYRYAPGGREGWIKRGATRSS